MVRMRAYAWLVAAFVLSVSGGASSTWAGPEDPDDYEGGEELSGMALFGGGDFTEDDYFAYGGFEISLQGDLNESGFVVYGLSGYGESDVFSGGDNSDGAIVDALLGYKLITPLVNASLYAGFGYNEDSDEQYGFKIQGGLSTADFSQLYASVFASYFTSEDSFYTQGRLGYNHTLLKVGPELAYSRDDDNDTIRVGGFISDVNLGWFYVGVAAGYAFEDGIDENDSVYGTIDFYTEF